MIHSALIYIRDILNENFRKEFSISENKVVLSNLSDQDGSLAHNTEGKIVFFLVNLDEEPTLKNNLNRFTSKKPSSFSHGRATMYLNMRLMFCANFTGKNYIEGLQYFSQVIHFFQNTSDLSFDSAKGRRLNFELSQENYGDLGHIWSSIGSKMLPSVLYKVGVLTFDDTPIQKIIPAVTQSNITP